MTRSVSPHPDFSARLSFWLLAAFLVLLWLVGGASRADVPGQALTRFFAWTSLAIFVLFSSNFHWRRITPIGVFLGISIALLAGQLIPLPPFLWTALPGRDLLVGAAEVSGQSQPWRPISISPSATANALGALVVPAAVLVLSANLSRDQQWRIVELLLALILAGCIIALLQFSGAQFSNPFINYISGSISGNFANSNHFALFVAIGCLIAPVWGFRPEGTARWKSFVALALLAFFLLIILATGSRSGILLGSVGVLSGLFIVRGNVSRELQSLPRWAAFGLVGAVFLVLACLIIASIVLGRAIAVDRALDAQLVGDLRSKALPYVLAAIIRYFPVGAGAGTFDAAYRIVEPDVLLQSTYFNHAHNDWLEVVLDNGVAGAILLVGAVSWVVFASQRAWRVTSARSGLARMASVVLLLTMLASVTDYPARTPMIMAVLVMAATWLSLACAPSRSSAGEG